MAQVKEHIETSIEDQGQNTQNSFMLFNSIGDSLPAAVKCKLYLQCNKFQRDGTGIGALLLKMIIQTAYIDTRSMTMQLRINLSSLDSCSLSSLK